jgi:hypothetical protein
MSKKNKTISRNEPSATSVNVAPAGAPTAAARSEEPAAINASGGAASGESPAEQEPVGATQSQEVVSAIKQEPRAGGASFFIPAHKPSGFGVK